MENHINIMKAWQDRKEEYRVYVNQSLYKIFETLEEAEEFAYDFKLTNPVSGDNYTIEINTDI